MARLAGRKQARAFLVGETAHPAPWFTQAADPLQRRGLQPAPLDDRGREGMTEGREIAVDRGRGPGLGQPLLTGGQTRRGHLVQAERAELRAPPGQLGPLVGLRARPFAGQDLAAVALQELAERVVEGLTRRLHALRPEGAFGDRGPLAGRQVGKVAERTPPRSRIWTR